MSIKVVSYSGEKVKEWASQISALRIEVFREFPFLYDGDFEYEKKYLAKFASVKDAIVVVAMDGSKIVGASTGFPFSAEGEDVKKPFLQASLNPNDYFYFGESVLKKNYRGKGIGNLFFDEREKHVHNLKKFRFICFCTVKRDGNDPRRPQDYRPLNGFWEKRGYKQHPELTCQISWKEMGEKNETPKQMVFWIKKL